MAIGTIEQELAACKKAWEPYQKKWWGVFAWNFHHSLECEGLRAAPQERIHGIMTEKDEDERAVRLHDFRPMKTAPDWLKEADEKHLAAWKKCDMAWAEYYMAWKKYNAALKDHKPELDAAHLQDVPGHTWNGTTIF